ARRPARAPTPRGSSRPPSRAPGHGGHHRVPESAPAPEGLLDRRGLEPAVDHAVAALLVAAPLPVALPARALEQLLEAPGVALLQEAAGALPAENVEGRGPPGRALVVPLPHEELEEQRRLVEAPPPLRVRQDAPEEVVRPLLAEEVLLVGRLGVAVAGGDHHPLDAELHHRVEELPHPLGVGALEQGRVRRPAGPPPEPPPDPSAP